LRAPPRLPGFCGKTIETVPTALASGLGAADAFHIQFSMRLVPRWYRHVSGISTSGTGRTLPPYGQAGQFSKHREFFPAEMNVPWDVIDRQLLQTILAQRCQGRRQREDVNPIKFQSFDA